jgi:hypothetical protein
MAKLFSFGQMLERTLLRQATPGLLIVGWLILNTSDFLALERDRGKVAHWCKDGHPTLGPASLSIGFAGLAQRLKS